VNAWVGELLGQAYVKKHFSEDDKQVVGDMIQDVIKVRCFE
jgi:predicted metalloendopeptidase